MKIKKWMSALLATSMVAGLALTGCGSSDEGKTGDAGKSTGDTKEAAGTETEGGEESLEGTKIVIFQSKVEIVDQLEACAEEFANETGIEVEVWGTTGDDYLQQLKTKLANNQGPTLFNQTGYSELEMLQGYAADLTDLPVVSQVADGLLDAVTVDSKVYGVPYTVEGFGLVYNKDLCDATTLKSTDDFINLIKEQKANGVEGFELSQETYFLIGHILNTPFALQENPEQFIADLEEGKVKMADNEIFKEFADMLVQIKENCQNPLEQNYDGEVGDLATGKAAMIHQGNWCISLLQDFEFENVGLAPLPLAGNDKLAVAAPSYWTVNSQATEQEQAAAKKFIEWLYTSETGKNYLYNEFKFIPVLEGETTDGLDVLSADVSKYVSEGKTIGWPNKLWPAGVVDVYFAPLAQKFFTEDMTAEQFLTELDQAYADAVANAA